MAFSNVPIDAVQQYWDERPCNVRHSAARVGTLQYFNEVRARKYKVEPHIPKFACFPKWKGKTVLEVGCGIGTDTIEFALEGAKVIAVDISAESIDLARQRAHVYGLEDRIGFVQGNAENLFHEVPHLRYDLVYSFGVLHHTPNPLRAISEIAALSAPNTALKLMLYNRMSLKVAMLTKGNLWDNAAIAKQSEAQTGCPVTYTYTPCEVRDMLDPWFTVDHVRTDHIFPYKIEPYKRYEYEREWWARIPGFGVLEHVLGWHLLIDARRSHTWLTTR